MVYVTVITLHFVMLYIIISEALNYLRTTNMTSQQLNFKQ